LEWTLGVNQLEVLRSLPLNNARDTKKALPATHLRAWQSMREREALVLGLKDAYSANPHILAVGDHDGDAKMQAEVSRRADERSVIGDFVDRADGGLRPDRVGRIS